MESLDTRGFSRNARAEHGAREHRLETTLQDQITGSNIPHAVSLPPCEAGRHHKRQARDGDDRPLPHRLLQRHQPGVDVNGRAVGAAPERGGEQQAQQPPQRHWHGARRAEAA